MVKIKGGIMVKDKLEIILITYNRVVDLSCTLEQIFASDSPIKNFDITILNNASFDGTDEVISKYQKKFPNLKHVRNPINIGGNANICRAYEMAALSGKEYAWVLCDDDVYDFKNWGEVEQNIEAGKDIICLSDYVFPSDKYKNNKAYQVFQLTFVPACIFKTSNIDDSIISNMYESIFSMFQQIVLVANVINNEKEIHVLSKPIVFNGLHFENKRTNRSYTRGTKRTEITERRRESNWVLGFSNIITLLNDKKIQQECLEVSIPYVDIYASWRNFYVSIILKYFNRKGFNYFYEIYKRLKFKRKICLWIYFLIYKLPKVQFIPFYVHSSIVYLKMKCHNLKCK